jgi:TonB family protein
LNDVLTPRIQAVLRHVAIGAAAIMGCGTACAADAQSALKFDLYACQRPVWPAAALAQHASGTTTLEARIHEQGYLLEARVTGSAGRADLDDAALDSLRGCTYHAVVSTGEAPGGWLKTQFRWFHTGAFPAPDPARLVTTTAQATGGDPVAQNRLGAWYERGTNVRTDLAQAALWYERAARAGNAHAQNNLGVLFWRGAGVPRDPYRATWWYAQAAAQGHGWAQANLAWSYQHGLGNDPDPELALDWLTQAAEGGLPDAQVRLGTMLMRSAANDDDRHTAAGWLARAAAQDDASGLYLLGRTFELGLGNVQDDVEAAALYRRALGRSAGRAETALGILLDTLRAQPQHDDEAAHLYERAMSARHPAAFYRYGLLMEQRGEDALALAMYQHAAAQRNCDAVLKYVQLRPAALLADPRDSHPPRWAQQQRGCSTDPAMQPRFE